MTKLRVNRPRARAARAAPAAPGSDRRSARPAPTPARRHGDAEAAGRCGPARSGPGRRPRRCGRPPRRTRTRSGSCAAARPAPGSPRRRSARTSRRAGRPWPGPGRRRTRRRPAPRTGRRTPPAAASRASPETAASTRGSSWPASATTNRQPGIGDHGPAHHLGDLQRSAAPGGPAAGHDAGRHVLRAEPAVADPGVAPGPAVRRPDAVELLVLQQQRHRRVVDLAQHPGPGVGQLDAGPGERPQHLGRRVRVQLAHAERVGDLPRSARPAGAAARPPATARRAARRSSASCTSARHGSPAWPISAAISAPADSAATSSRNRPGCSVASIRARWSA